MALTAHSEGENTSQLEKDLADALIEVGKQNMKIDGSSDDEKREKSMRNLAHPIAEAIEKGCSFSIKGTATVADINALKDMAEGDIWAVSDSGTIYNIVGEALEVTAGDLIRYDGTRWTNFLHIDLSGYVTTEQLNAAVATINAAIAAVSSTLGSHADNKSNPHNVTAGQTGAYTKAETDAKIDEVSGGIAEHIADKSNPHSVTAGQVGAYTKTETDTKISEVGASISTHTADTSNPHSVTAEQVGAYTKEQVDGFIRNWSGYVVVPFGQEKPSASEAQLGKIYLVQVSNDPEVKDQYEEWISDGTAWSLIGTMSIDLSPYDKIVDAEAREKVINDALTAHKNDAVAHITAAERTSWNGAVSNSHTHSNKAELDKIASGDKSKWDAKQDAISDLATIRSGAAAGATAVQPSSLAKVATSGSYNDLSNKPTIPAAITIDSAMSSTSTNPVQNKVVNSALSGKMANPTRSTFWNWENAFCNGLESGIGQYSIHNSFYALNKRGYETSIIRTNKDGTTTDLSEYAEQLYNADFNNYTIRCTSNSTTVIRIYRKDGGAGSSKYIRTAGIYPYGYLFVYFYNWRPASDGSVSARYYAKYSDYDGWQTPAIVNGNGYYLYFSISHFNVSEIEITINAGTHTYSYPSLNEIAFIPTRPDGSIADSFPYVRKYTNETLYYKLTAPEFVGKLTGNSDSSTKLATARSLGVNLARTAASTFDGSANQLEIPIKGQLADTHIASASKWNAKQDALSAMTADFVNGEWDK